MGAMKLSFAPLWILLTLLAACGHKTASINLPELGSFSIPDQSAQANIQRNEPQEREIAGPPQEEGNGQEIVGDVENIARDDNGGERNADADNGILPDAGPRPEPDDLDNEEVGDEREAIREEVWAGEEEQELPPSPVGLPPLPQGAMSMGSSCGLVGGDTAGNPWIDGGYYYLEGDIEVSFENNNQDCFNISNGPTLDCRGHTIRSTNKTGNGITLSGNASRATIINCNIENFQYGIRVFASNNSNLRNNRTENNIYGIDLNMALGTTLENNRSCNNQTLDLRCRNQFESGGRNVWTHVESTCRLNPNTPWPRSPQDYVACDGSIPAAAPAEAAAEGEEEPAHPPCIFEGNWFFDGSRVDVDGDGVCDRGSGELDPSFTRLTVSITFGEGTNAQGPLYLEAMRNDFANIPADGVVSEDNRFPLRLLANNPFHAGSYSFELNFEGGKPLSDFDFLRIRNATPANQNAELVIRAITFSFYDGERIVSTLNLNQRVLKAEIKGGMFAIFPRDEGLASTLLAENPNFYDASGIRFQVKTAETRYTNNGRPETAAEANRHDTSLDDAGYGLGFSFLLRNSSTMLTSSGHQLTPTRVSWDNLQFYGDYRGIPATDQDYDLDFWASAHPLEVEPTPHIAKGSLRSYHLCKRGVERINNSYCQEHPSQDSLEYAWFFENASLSLQGGIDDYWAIDWYSVDLWIANKQIFIPICYQEVHSDVAPVIRYGSEYIHSGMGNSQLCRFRYLTGFLANP